MRAIGEAVLEAWSPRGLLIDLRELSHEWGGQLEDVFYIGSDKYPSLLWYSSGKNLRKRLEP